jgi:hypothetical protein
MNGKNEFNAGQKLEDIWKETCGTWQNCNESTVQSFMAQCEQQSIDPQVCLNWIQKHKEEIPNWPAVSDVTREWVIDHTSTGSPVSDS